MKKSFTLNIIAFAVVVCFTLQPLWVQGSVKESVVKVYTTSIVQDYDEPWKTLSQESTSGSGCIISGNRILTAAHVVANQIFVQVRRAGKAEKYTAEVEQVAHDCELAILKVKDASFFSETQPVAIGALLQIGDDVTTYGFPAGGDKLCRTEGVVSRVEHTAYVHSNTNLLACQIDAAINPGSSGGPVIKDEKLVGVAFEGGGGENIGYMVPTPIISHFLDDIKDGTYAGIADLGIYTQKMENSSLRAKFGMSDDQSGVLVNKIYMGSPAEGILQPGDVILSIDGTDVANDATVEFRKGERTIYAHIIQQKHINDHVRLKTLSNQTLKNVEIQLTKPVNFERLVPHEQFDVTPTYYIFGGLVFEPLTENYLMTWGEAPYSDAPSALLNYYKNGERTPERKEVVVLVKVLPDEINAGYHQLIDRVVSCVNGRKISTMEDLVIAFEQHEGKYHVIEDENGYKIVLDRDEVEQNGQTILKKFKIISKRSTDLKN